MSSLTSVAANNIGSLLTGMALEVTCPVCNSLFDPPAVTYCKHAFCSHCIKKSIEETGKCPTCQEPLTIDQLRDSTKLQLIVDEIKDMHRIYQQATTLDLSQIPPQHLTDQDRTLSVKVENSINDAKDIQHYRICQLNQNPIDDLNLPNIIFERKINANTTHIVLDADIHGLVSPSYLYRIGILCGCYIVNENWLKICKEKNQMVPEERFEIQGDTTHGRTGAPCKARTNRNLKKPNLFKGTRVKVIAEPKSKVEKLLLAGRAMLEGDFDTVVVCNPKEVNISELRQTYPGKLLISGDWVNDCVDSYEIVKKDSYILTE